MFCTFSVQVCVYFAANPSLRVWHRLSLSFISLITSTGQVISNKHLGNNDTYCLSYCSCNEKKKITADGECNHEIKTLWLLERKAMTNWDSILKSRDIILPTKVHIVKAMVFPLVIYGCESWTTEKAEHGKIDAFELWCWRRLLTGPWTARKSNQSVLKEINPE